jgi:hypothetical protein
MKTFNGAKHGLRTVDNLKNFTNLRASSSSFFKDVRCQKNRQKIFLG